MTVPWLTFLGLVPLIGAVILCLPVKLAARPIGLVVSFVTAVIGIGVVVAFLGGTAFGEKVPWIKAFGAWWALRLDGMSAFMVLMTVILTPLVLVAERKLPDRIGRWSPAAYFGLVLLLESLSLFVFMADDVLLFYLFFEATLIPVYFLIGGFGGAGRSRAAIKFLLFSLAGGLVMLASVIGVYAYAANLGRPSYLLADLAALHIDGTLGRWLMLGFLLAFIVKAPMVPVHTWLPEAAEQGTPGTSVLLVGVLDKIGTFGMIKFCLGLFPEASRWAAPVMIILALISVIYGAAAAFASKNLLRLIAYTSVSHFGLMVLGIYSFTTQSITGSIFYMLNHGFSIAALFLVVGFLVKRRGSANISAYGGVQKVAPLLSGALLLAGLSSLALPGMSSFVSEFLVLAGSWARNPVVGAVAALGMVLSAVYILTMYQRTMTGPLKADVAQSFGRDLSGSEKLVVLPLIGLMLVLGFFPNLALTSMQQAANAAMTSVQVTTPGPQAGK